MTCVSVIVRGLILLFSLYLKFLYYLNFKKNSAWTCDFFAKISKLYLSFLVQKKISNNYKKIETLLRLIVCCG